MDQLVQLNKYVDEIKDMDVTVYGVSPSSVEDHAYLKEMMGLEFEILSDVRLEFGEKLGFVDTKKQSIFRGYVAVNLVSETIEKEIDYLVGENAEAILAILKDL